jgi:hypothetical protein
MGSLTSGEGAAQFPNSSQEVFNAVLEAANRMPGMKVKQADPNSGYVLISIGVNFWSWGEDLPIQITETAPGQTWLQIASSSKFALIDFGKNQRNVDKLMRTVAEVLSARAVPGSQPPVTVAAPGAIACAQCGATLAGDAKFCTSCGTPVAKA